MARPRSSSSTAVVTASRNQRSWATRITPASIVSSSSSSHSIVSMSRWLVGSSSRACLAERRARGRARLGSALRRRSSRAAARAPRRRSPGWAPRGRSLPPVVAAGVLEPSLRAGVAGERAVVVGAGGHQLFELAQLGSSAARSAVPPEHVVAQRHLDWCAGGRWSCSAMRMPRRRKLAAVEGELACERP